MRYICSLMLLLALPFSSCSRPAESPDTSKIVAAIRKDFKEINDSLRFFEHKELTVFDESTEGTLLETWSRNAVTRKIVVTSTGEMGQAVFEYYLKNSVLFFAYYVVEYYDKPMYEPDSKRTSRKEDRYYFNEGKLLRWLDEKGKSQSPGNKEFNDREKLILDDFKNYTGRLSR